MKKIISGFTLIEALLGILIFSIIASSLYGVFHSGLQINRRSEDVNQIYREIRWSLERMSKDLGNMASYDFSNSDAKKTAFTATDGKISFIIPTEEGLKVVSYFLRDPQEDSIYKVIVGKHSEKNSSVTVRYEEKENLQLLVREEKPFEDIFRLADNQKIDEEIFSPNVKTGSLKFSYAYFAGKEDNGKIVWRDHWSGKYIPSGVRIEMTFVKNNKTSEPVTIQKDVFIPIGYLGQ